MVRWRPILLSRLSVGCDSSFRFSLLFCQYSFCSNNSDFYLVAMLSKNKNSCKVAYLLITGCCFIRDKKRILCIVCFSKCSWSSSQQKKKELNIYKIKYKGNWRADNNFFYCTLIMFVIRMKTNQDFYFRVFLSYFILQHVLIITNTNIIT